MKSEDDVSSSAGDTEKDGSAEAKVPVSGLPQTLSPENKDKIITLYQQNPKMWPDFRLIIDLKDHLEDNALEYPKTRDILIQLMIRLETSSDVYEHQLTLSKFCAFSGTVDALVKLYSDICRDKGRNYVTELLPPFSDAETWCMYFVKTLFLVLSCFGPEFRLALAKTGFLVDFVMDDLCHMKHQSADALKSGGVYIESMGTLFNCCRHPEVVQILRQTSIVQHVLAFVDKDVYVIKGLALITLAFLVEDSDLDLIQLDLDTLQYFLDTTSASFTSQGRQSEGWQTDAVVHGLSQFARNDVNRRRIVTQGGLHVLIQVLDSAGIQVQREVVMETLVALSQDTGNAYVLKMNRELGRVLERVTKGDLPSLRHQAAALLKVIQQIQVEDDDIDDSSYEFLRESSNALEILGVGVIEYILENLKFDSSTTRKSTLSQETGIGGGSGIDIGSGTDTGSATDTRSGIESTGSGSAAGNGGLEQVLQALLFMAQDDNKKRDIFARGGLDLLTTHIEKGVPGVKQQALNVVQALASSSEYGEIIQSHRGLCQVTRDFVHSDNIAMS